MPHSDHIHYSPSRVTRHMRQALLRQRAHLFWFTGLSGAGKSTLANALQVVLHEQGRLAYVLDGDNVRHGLCRDLGFSPEDRAENIRRIGEMCNLFLDAGVICLAAFISPSASVRETVRDLVGPDRFSEIYVRCPLAVCEQRDVKGNYKKARAGKIPGYTGVSSPYEEPGNPDLLLDTQSLDREQCLTLLLEYARPLISIAREIPVGDYEQSAEI